MTAFVVICAAMIAAALLWLIWPLLRRNLEAAERRGHRAAAVALVIAVPALAAAMYASLSDWDFNEVERQAATTEEADRLLAQLEAKLAENPQDIDGWLLLGRSNVAMGRYDRAVEAFQHAYDASKGQNVEAAVNLGEALVLVDSSNLGGRSSALFDAALERAPNHPKALWYGGMAALQAGDLRKGRDRLALLLAQNPPEQVRAVLERQVQDLDAQIGEAGEGGQAQPGRSLRVQVSIAPSIQAQLTGPLPLFVLARDPAGGPPLAVERHTSTSLPLTVELSASDAMTPARTIASAARVQVVARISRSGAPQERSGDLYGVADYDFASGDTGVVNIVIDQIVP